MFSYNTLKLGTTFIPGESRTIEFPYEGIHIINMSASCGCSTPINDEVDKKVKVNYTAQEIPIHIKNEGRNFYSTTKKIVVKYWITDPKNIQEVTLDFTATVMGKIN